MKKIIYLLMAIATISLTSCTENFSNGKRVGTITQFSKTGNFFKSYEGHLNVTQTGMNTASGFDFSLDNDNEPKGVAELLDSAQNYGWKVELTYHQVSGKNWFGNRGHTDYFITDVKVLDRNFNSIFTNIKDTTGTKNHNSVVTKDTVFTINLTMDEARKMGILK
jgi:hypothetical protein